MIEVEVNGVAIIVGHPTGVRYTNQSDGTCCQQMTLEGFAVPYDLGLPEWQREIEGYFFQHYGNGGHINDADADFLEKYLCLYRVDRSRLKDSMEAWVYVTPRPGCGFPHGLTTGPVVFCWPNSD